MQFLDDKRGWLYSHERLYHSLDGGITWYQIFRLDDQPSHFNSYLTDNIEHVKFVSDLIGWMVRRDGFFTSHDGGNHWERIRLHVDRIGDLVPFGSGENGYLAASYYDRRRLEREGILDVSVSHLFTTRDGGKTWKDTDFVRQGVNLSKLFFIDETQGWALFTTGVCIFANGKWQSKVYFRDATCNHNPAFIVPDDPVKLYGDRYADKGVPLTMDIWFVDSKVGWVSFMSGDLLATEDGGRTWCRILEPRDVWAKRTSPIADCFVQIISVMPRLVGCWTGGEGCIEP